MVPPVEQLTADGYDLQFGTNCLGKLFHSLYFTPRTHFIRFRPGHFYFVKLLIPVLLETSKDGPKARVITTSSSTHMFCDIDFETLEDGPKRIAKGTNDLYSQSKYVSLVFLSG